jgi:hypothetical protein
VEIALVIRIGDVIAKDDINNKRYKELISGVKE